jgi:hypothetical protein
VAGRDNTVIASYFAPQHNISQVACCGASGYLATGLGTGPSAGAGGGTSGIPAAGGAGGAGGTGMSFSARAPRAGGGGGGGAPTGGAGGATGAIAPTGGAGGAGGGGGGGAHLLLAPRQSGCSAACARLADSGKVMARPRARLDRMMRFMVFSLVGMKHILRPQCGEIMETPDGVYTP